jgi:hypothetical protein
VVVCAFVFGGAILFSAAPEHSADLLSPHPGSTILAAESMAVVNVQAAPASTNSDPAQLDLLAVSSTTQLVPASGVESLPIDYSAVTGAPTAHTTMAVASVLHEKHLPIGNRKRERMMMDCLKDKKITIIGNSVSRHWFFKMRSC